MSSLLDSLRSSPDCPRGVVFIRLAVGLIFFTQGILKFTDPKMGVERFTKIGLRIRRYRAFCGLL
jgi:uncharacterized membrane protein YphA (DoxX/SURF4 family)